MIVVINMNTGELSKNGIDGIEEGAVGLSKCSSQFILITEVERTTI